jgi:ethanolamine ammonia-lyase large subunit
VKKLIDDLNLIQATQALPSPEQLDSTLKTLEATKSRLENNDLTDDGEYTLELMLETPNPASPQPFRQVIPLIRGTQ